MKALNILKPIGFFVFTMSLIFTTVVGYNHYNNLKIVKSFENETRNLDEKVQAFQSSIRNKNAYILEMTKNSKKISVIKNNIDLLENLVLQTQDDFDRFESINSSLNQTIAAEAVLLNSAEKSLFPTEAYLRKMETFDLAVDKSRLELSKATFVMNANLKKLRFDPFLGTKLSKAPVFKIDQLILSSK